MTEDYQGPTPPPELVEQWLAEARKKLGPYHEYVAIKAARWGADRELDWFCEWLRSKDILEPAIDALRADRRPKPPSLAEEALAELEVLSNYAHEVLSNYAHDLGCSESVIRRALERLQELEGGND